MKEIERRSESLKSFIQKDTMSDLLKALNGHPQHSEPVGSWIGMIVATSVMVAATLRLGW
jgi:hypothetical protein